MNRAELGALRDAIDTILNWPDSVRDQIAQWLQTDQQIHNPFLGTAASQCGQIISSLLTNELKAVR